MGAVLHFPARERVEVTEAVDHGGRRLWLFDMVGADECGPFRICIADRYLAEEARADVTYLRGHGIAVTGALP